MDEQQNIDQQQYIRALKEQDNVICQEIYNRFLPQVIAMIVSKGGSEEEARSIFQQAILAILSTLKVRNIVLKTSFGAYLNGICHHKFVDLCRKKKNEDVLRLNSEKFIDSEEVDHSLKKETLLNLLWQCFEMLSDECKKIIKGKLDGLSPKEIMEQINYTKPVNAFYQKRFDCMRRLKLLIAQHPTP